MATEVVKIVDPDNGSGTDYTSLSAWEAGQQQDLVTNDRIAVAKCRCTGGTADTTAVTISGWTTDLTHYIKIWTDPAEGYRHEGKWQTGNKYRISIDDDAGIILEEFDIRLDGLQVEITNVENSGRTAIRNWADSWPSTGETYITNCIVKGVTDTKDYNHEGIGLYDASSTGGSGVKFFIANCVAYNFRSIEPWQWAAGFDHDCESGSSSAYFYNCTAHNCDHGFIGTNTKVTNCIANDCTSGKDFYLYAGSWISGSGYNATDLSDANSGAPGSNNRYEQTFSFVDADNGDFHLQASDTGAKGYGLNLYNDSYYAFQNDIDGQDRGGSGAQWDIGADECVVSLPPQLLTPQRSVQHMLVR